MNLRDKLMKLSEEDLNELVKRMQKQLEILKLKNLKKKLKLEQSGN